MKGFTRFPAIQKGTVISRDRRASGLGVNPEKTRTPIPTNSSHEWYRPLQLLVSKLPCFGMVVCSLTGSRLIIPGAVLYVLNRSKTLWPQAWNPTDTYVNHHEVANLLVDFPEVGPMRQSIHQILKARISTQSLNTQPASMT